MPIYQRNSSRCLVLGHGPLGYNCQAKMLHVLLLRNLTLSHILSSEPSLVKGLKVLH